MTIQASPENVYAALTGKVGSWWNPEHTYSHDSRNLSIDARPGGCFCEKLDNGGGVEHMKVVLAWPGRMLRMTGALGPLQGSGLAGSMIVLPQRDPNALVEPFYLQKVLVILKRHHLLPETNPLQT